jgi:polar amino acid transport system substrate-binding protein
MALGPFWKTFVICIAGVCFASAANAGEKVVLYGDENYAPYSYVEKGQFKGMYVDILEKAAEKLKPAYDITLQPVPWKRGLADLEFGSSFALFPPGLKRERTYIDLYSVPIYRETVAIFCNDAVMAKPRSRFPEDFNGLTIGVNLGFLLSDRLMQSVKAGTVKTESAKNNDANLKKLASRRIDCFASDRAAALHATRQLETYFAASGFKLQEAVELSGEDTFIGYSGKNNPAYKADFIAKMDAALETMKRNGQLTKIVAGYLR